MAFEEGAVFIGRITSPNVSTPTFSSADGAVMTYSSGGIPQFYCVTEDTTTGKSQDVILQTTAAARVLGIAQDAPAVGPGQPIRILRRGVGKAVAGGAITAGDALAVNASGQVVTAAAATAQFLVGRAVEGAVAAGDTIAIDVNPTDAKVTTP